MEIDRQLNVKSFRMTEIAHLLLAVRIQEGDTVIDATAGNGGDTVFLAQRVGDTGKVHAFDIQQQAIENTRKRLASHGLLHRVDLHHTSHTEIAQLETPVKAVVFNLGYLPGSDKRIITRPDTTCAAISAALTLLQAGGIIVAVLYQGHESGNEEATTVEKFARQLPNSDYIVSKYEHLNVSNDPPYVLVLGKR